MKAVFIRRALWVLLFGGLIYFSLTIGNQYFSFSKIVNIFYGQSSDTDSSILQLRLYRTLTAICSGILLSLAGLLFQALFRNDLATPYTLGISSAASLGAYLSILLALDSFLLVWLFSLTGGVMNILLLILMQTMLTRQQKNTLFSNFRENHLILAGVALGYFFNAFILLIRYIASPFDLSAMEAWLFGSLQLVNLNQVSILLLLTVGYAIFSRIMASTLDLFSFSEDYALSINQNLARNRFLIIAVTTVVITAMIGLTGPIAFIGLIVPHIVKKVKMASHRQMVITNIFFGGFFLLLLDVLNRLISSIGDLQELPIGLITSIIGVPIFLVVLMKKN